MMQQRGWFLVAPLWLVCGALGACSSDDDKADSPEVTLPEFFDLPSAPEKIQSAAKAVVRLSTARYYGTGSFISSTGLLLTNNHVLGETECPVEGCVVSVAGLHQVGEHAQAEVEYWATPVTFDAGLDIAVLQLAGLYATDDAVSTPNYLRFEEHTSESLLGEHVTVVGHPVGALKKWSEGTVVDATGKWLTSTNFILPGDSGSPILNDDGKIVGIAHRGPDGIDFISNEGVSVYTIGTDSASIKAALDAPLPTAAFYTNADTTEAAVLTYESALANSQQTYVTIDGNAALIIDILGRACDTALTLTNFSSPEQLYAALSPCITAEYWIDCRQDYALMPNCPDDAERARWRERFQAVNALQMAMNGVIDYATVGPAIAQLEDTYEEGRVAGTKSLKTILDAAAPTLNFDLAYYLAMLEIEEYAGVNVGDFVTNYAEVPGYELGATDAAYAGAWLAANRAITSKEFAALLRSLMSDPKVTAGTKLTSEEMLYNMGAL